MCLLYYDLLKHLSLVRFYFAFLSFISMKYKCDNLFNIYVDAEMAEQSTEADVDSNFQNQVDQEIDEMKRVLDELDGRMRKVASALNTLYII